MIRPRAKQKPEDVAAHYDGLDEFYRDVWGEHVHHGLWRTGRESPEEAVVELVRVMARELGLENGARVCDVGCGYGATARLLARDFGAAVTGFTLSEAQYEYACDHRNGDDRTEYFLRDWIENDLPDEEFDAVIFIESSEHIEDKATAFKEACRVLRRGGRVGIYSWLARENLRPWHIDYLLEPICREGCLPGMGNEGEYVELLRSAGFEKISFQDFSRNVSKTWSVCVRRVVYMTLTDPRTVLRFFKMDPANRKFLVTVFRILLAYRFGVMRYGLFTAVKA